MSISESKFAAYLRANKTRFWKFGLVGISGIVVNEGLLALFTEVIILPLALAGAVAIESSILSNFLLNNFWTWRDARHKSFRHRIFSYHSVALIAGLVNYFILIALTMLGMHPLLANLIGIAFGTLINFLLNQHWTFGKI